MSLTDSMRDYLNEPRFAILATTGKSGRIHNKPSCGIGWMAIPSS